MGNFPQRFAVTGAGGFIGRHVLQLLAERQCPVTVLSRRPRGEADEGLPGEWRTIDFSDGPAMREALRDALPDVLLHLAGTRGTPGDLFGSCLDGNTLATARVLEAAAAAGVARVLTVGSADEYGPQPGPQREDLPLRPHSAYGVSKAAATQVALAMRRKLDLPVVILRPFTVYGNGQPGSMFLSQAVRAAVNGEPFEMTFGTQRRDLVHVADVARALLLAAERSGLEGEVVNLGSGTPLPLAELARMVWRLSGSQAELRIGARKAAPEELYDTWADVTRARTLLDWQAEIPLKAGLLEMIGAATEECGGRWEMKCGASAR